MIFKLFGIFLVGLTTLFFVNNSIGSSSTSEVIQKRIEMFKSSETNIKKLSKLIGSSEISASVELVNFHVKWSEEMLRLFPLGSEASTLNGSDASSDIWGDTPGFKKRVKQYNLSSIDLREALKTRNIAVINKSFKDLVESCKTCHKQFRN